VGRDVEKLARRVRKARADTMQRHVLVCTDCDKGSKRAKQLRRAVNGARLRDRVTVTKVDCLDICEAEPIAVVYPEGAWYHSLDKQAVERIVDEHLDEGRILEDALFHVNALAERTRDEAA
jgi:(2Fe-2S) ferredoxin